MSCLKSSSWRQLFSVKSRTVVDSEETLQGIPTSQKSIASTKSSRSYHHDDPKEGFMPNVQAQLLLHAPKERYQLVSEADVPIVKAGDEAIVRIQTLGLNPIDWKGPAYNFGLPSFPCVLGREFVGVVVRAPAQSTKIQAGDVVLAISTDYRDYRKAAFQQYAIARESNLCRLPQSSPRDHVASLGVAFVTATISLGVSLGLRFPGLDLLGEVRSQTVDSLPEDIRAECHTALPENERLREGEWLAIWGAGSSIGFIALQLAKLAGVRVIAIADAGKRGGLLVDAGADVLVHRKHTEEAQTIVRSVVKGNLHYGIDTVGKSTAETLQGLLSSSTQRRAHIVGLTGLPKGAPETVVQHKVPIKLFHEHKQIGEKIMRWLEDLLHEGKLILPEVEVYHDNGLSIVNDALGRLSSGDLQAQRLVVKLS